MSCQFQMSFQRNNPSDQNLAGVPLSPIRSNRLVSEGELRKKFNRKIIIVDEMQIFVEKLLRNEDSWESE